ncbi:MAG: DctP family TRAP transporter solute-binding subunit [Planctomycetes bacterium]|nr:DctP family TRAP transporter solute-binding subunit [Planctomycetota bacterium]
MKDQGYYVIIAISIIAIFAILSYDPSENSAVEQELGEKISGDISLKLGHDMSINSAVHLAALKYAQEVARKSNERIHIDIFPNQILGTDAQMIQKARTGELDIALPPTAKLSLFNPALQFCDLPFAFTSAKQCYQTLDGPIGDELLQSLELLGLVGAAFWESGFKQFTANKALIEYDDFKALRMRVMKSDILFKQFRLLGAQPIHIEFHQTKKALAEFVVDGQENPFGSIYNMKFHHHQSHITESNHAYLAYTFCLSSKTLDKLSANDRKILLRTARELSPFQRELANKKNDEYKNELLKYGVKIVELTNQDKRGLRELLEPLYHNYQLQIHQKGYEKTQEYMRGIIAKDNLYIGLDADLTLGSAPSGIAIKRGIEMAIEEINSKGGVHAKRLKLIALDNGGVSARGINNLHYLSKLENCIAVCGGLHSPVTLSELPIIHEKNLIYLCPWAAATHIVSNDYEPNNVFRLSVRDEYAGPFLVKHALSKGQKVALLLENTGWGRSNLRSIKHAMQSYNVQPVGVEWFNWGEKDFRTRIKNCINQGADVLITVCNAPEGAMIVRDLSRMEDKVPVVSHWGITGGYFWKEVKEELREVDLSFLQTFSFMKARRQKVIDFIETYGQKYTCSNAGDIFAPVGTAHAYDLIHILALALEQIEDLSADNIRHALENMSSYDGLIKKYEQPFSRHDHEALSMDDFIMAKYNLMGEIIPVSEDDDLKEK